MPENESIADGAELAWQRKAIWLLVRALGGEVTITDEEWERAPERPELVIDRADGLMRWTAKERSDEGGAASPVAAELDGPEIAGQLALPGTEPT